MIQTKTLKEALKDPGVIEVVEELIFKYTLVNSYAELDGIKWNNTKRGTIYTFSGMSDHQLGITPADTGCVVVLRYGTSSTLQVLIGGNGVVAIRRLLTGVENWTAWVTL